MHTLSLKQLADGLRSKQFSSRELTQHYLKRIETHDPKLNSFITVTPEIALAQADAADARIKAGQAGPLTGVPIAQKDIFCTQGVRTSCASRMLDKFIAPYDATVVTKLHGEGGAVMLGKCNMDEFAMGSSNETSWYGPVKNPWDLTRVPGGSSGGSVAAVAALLAPVATATDTGGSIRQPAALTNLTGIKPTYGRVSRFGMIAFASSLDQGGVVARSAEDAAVVLQAMSGFDPRDSTSVERDVDDYLRDLNRPIDGLRIGLPKEYFAEGLEPAIRACVEQAVKQFEQLGAKIVEVSLPHAPLSVPTYYVVAPAEASSNLARFDGVRYGHRTESSRTLEELYKKSRGEGFGPEVQRRIMIGTYVLSHGYYDAYYLQAQKVRKLIYEDFRKVFEQCDVILGPTTTDVAFELNSKMDDPVAMYLNDIYTIAANLAGIPAMSLPCGFVGGLPVGMQLMGNFFEEARLLNVAHQYQQAQDWHRRSPAAFA
ncbi:aspartyl/glutamyl-tRNA(Asn/Gln) amidotransferase subunit A [Panacagrimonas perspica]|uniref:Glutamyl-tRNA(Gln) amidotransferase subunit A n=1 Tax=Panacagrimonas perspica TaxID=381431 RepID=A0A4R7NZX1_9GAMM|nr:Asp-tRNA(Asn)/Glu-tRNA(Gln) amidotransferase subunit GatA [Panacagrimonas perspica]TDU26817.1 aspartyl/glutamyl-tRNA(Asn/Gln) amidotransferase subunit A [Panacagrimonas perspica]THD03595.1 aspartyl/glutamyl-tRNA amidotransferase subunit A [Panacagrimonas perspica]